MRTLSKAQGIQESQYKYPYHYIPSWDGQRFSQCQTLSSGYEYLSYLHFVIDELAKVPHESILDVGCGDGRLLSEISRTMPEKRLVGIDYSERAIGFARLLTPTVEWVCGDITDPAAMSQTFEVVTLVETIEHIPPHDLNNFLKGVHSYMKAEGVLILTAPSTNFPVSRKHYQHFDSQTLTKALQPFFVPEKTFHLNRFSPMLYRVYLKILENRLFILYERHLLKAWFQLYRRFFLFSDETNCRRIAMISRKQDLDK